MPWPRPRRIDSRDARWKPPVAAGRSIGTGTSRGYPAAVRSGVGWRTTQTRNRAGPAEEADRQQWVNGRVARSLHYPYAHFFYPTSVTPTSLPAFDDPGLLGTISTLTPDELDRLDFGVLGFDEQALVRIYS